MKILVIFVVSVAAIILVNSGSDNDSRTEPEPANTAAIDTDPDPEPAPEPERPGLAAVYAEIESSSDCGSLQETFDRNMGRYEMRDPLERTEEGNPGTWEFAYAGAALDRMQELGC